MLMIFLVGKQLAKRLDNVSGSMAEVKYIITNEGNSDYYSSVFDLSRSLSVGAEIINYANGQIVGILTEKMIDKFCQDIFDWCLANFNIEIDPNHVTITGDPGFTLFNYSTEAAQIASESLPYPAKSAEMNKGFKRQGEAIIDFLKSNEYYFYLN